jgi:hypothetical protein
MVTWNGFPLFAATADDADARRAAGLGDENLRRTRRRCRLLEAYCDLAELVARSVLAGTDWGRIGVLG